MNFNNPRINRVIGYVILFAGLIPAGTGMTFIKFDINGTLGFVLTVLGFALMVLSVFWMIKKVRCPWCGALLPLKLYPIKRCPYCKHETDDYRE